MPPLPAFFMLKPSLEVPEGFAYVWEQVINETAGAMEWDNLTEDLILYLKPSGEDWTRCPQLVGVEEIWIAMNFLTPMEV